MPRRAERREATLAAIRNAARELLVDEGLQAVGLRAVARKLDLTAPALYRYVRNPKELLGLVVEDACVELTEAIERAADDVSEGPIRRLTAASWAFRRWALDHPAEFGVVFANPELIAGPEAKGRFVAAFGRLFEELWRERPFPIPDDAELPAPLRDVDLDLPIGARYQFLWCWSRLYGAVCLEVFGQLDWILADGAAMFGQTLVEIGERLTPENADR